MRSGMYELRREASGDTHAASTLTLDLQPPGRGEHEFLSCQLLSLRFSVTAAARYPCVDMQPRPLG